MVNRDAQSVIFTVRAHTPSLGTRPHYNLISRDEQKAFSLALWQLHSRIEARAAVYTTAAYSLDYLLSFLVESHCFTWGTIPRLVITTTTATRGSAVPPIFGHVWPCAQEAATTWRRYAAWLASVTAICIVHRLHINAWLEQLSRSYWLVKFILK